MNLREMFIAAHLLGLCLSLLAALSADGMLIRGILSKTRVKLQEPLRIKTGFALLWISGIGLLVIYGMTDPKQLLNPKLWAKLLIILIGSINGLWIETRLIPNRLRAATVIPAVALSLSSWVSASLLGVARSANFSMAFGSIIAAYFGAAVVVAALGFAAYLFFGPRREERPVRNPAAAGPSRYPREVSRAGLWLRPSGLAHASPGVLPEALPRAAVWPIPRGK